MLDVVVIENEGKCGRHLHANAIRSQISQAENDGVKASRGIRTITPKDGTTMHFHHWSSLRTPFTGKLGDYSTFELMSIYTPSQIPARF